MFRQMQDSPTIPGPLALLSLLALPLFTACVRLGPEITAVSLPKSAPPLLEILTDLRRTNERIESFRAAGTFTLESPEFEGIRKFRSGRILFRKPSDLYAQGNHRITNTILFKLISVDKEFLIEFPTNSDESYYQLEGEEFVDVPFSVSPSDVVREMFLPEDWSEIRRRRARVVAYDEDTGIATMHVAVANGYRRWVDVMKINADDPQWVIVRNVFQGDTGDVIAITESGAYRDHDGILFPARVEAFFPTEATRMTFEMRNIRLNVPVPDEQFDIRARVRELNLPPSQILPGADTPDARVGRKTR